MLRNLTEVEIGCIKSFGNVADDWNNILVEAECAFEFHRIQRCNFFTQGKRISIRNQTGSIEYAGCEIPCGLSDSSFFKECYVANDCVIHGVSLICNVYFDSKSIVRNCGRILGSFDSSELNETSFPRSICISLGAESYGRNVVVKWDDSFTDICREFLRVPQPGTESGKRTHPDDRLLSKLAYIGLNAIIISCQKIENSYVGEGAVIDSSSLSHCVIRSSRLKPSRIVDGVVMNSCIVNENTQVERGAYLDSVYLCESSAVGEKARVHHTIVGPDSSVSGGECHHSVLGPFVGFHHESLLIASFWPIGRGNIAYSARVGANHTGRVNDQECWVGEGCFFGLGCSLKFPINLIDSPYSMIAPSTILSPQVLRYPFSLVLPIASPELPPDCCLLKPAWVLSSNPYMIERAAVKFSSRRKSALYNTSFSLVRPRIVKQVMRARRNLVEANISEFQGGFSIGKLDGAGKCAIAIKDINAGVTAYSKFVQRYALHGLFWSSLALSPNEFQELFFKAKETAYLLDRSLYDDSNGILELMDDVMLLQEQTIATSPVIMKGSSSGLLISDWSPNVLLHQLQVFCLEFQDAAIDFSAEPKSFSTAIGDLEIQGEYFYGLLPYFKSLERIEREFAIDVKDCREKDSERAVPIIPDYSAINPVSIDTNADGTVKRAANRAEFFRKFLELN